jgi:radical SAM superfamily enzyme YgiQ (UPF0313 family)
VIFLCDDNFTDNKKRAKELLRAMIRENFQFKWSTQARVDVATDLELVSLMKEAGCHTVFIGFESTNPENLKTMKKGQTVGQIKEAIRVIRNHGIHIHGMFVFGFDNDSDSTIDETVAFAKNSLISSAQFLLLTPFPGSEIYRQMKGDGRILFNDWSLYDTHHVVIRPRKMPLQALQAAQIKSHERFYSNFQLLRKCIVGDFVGVGIGVYARNLNRWWKKKNKVFCQVLGLMDLRKDVRVSISFEQRVEIPGISPMNNASPSDQFNQSA